MHLDFEKESIRVENAGLSCLNNNFKCKVRALERLLHKARKKCLGSGHRAGRF